MKLLKKLLKILGVIVVIIIVIAIGGYLYVLATWDYDYGTAPLPAIKASTDPAVIARGEYMVNAVAHCSGCHGLANIAPASRTSTIDWDMPLVGGFVIDIPLFGRFVPANITPDNETGIGRMSDGEIARAIRSGVGRTGRVIPFMLFSVGPMSDEDLTAIVSYLRSRKPVSQKNATEEWGLLAKALSGGFKPHLGPAPAHVPAGNGPSVERGRYLAEGPAACRNCHSPMDPMTFQINGPAFSGANMGEPDEADPTYEIIPPNLTPDKETGHIAGWDEDTFLRRLHGGRVFPSSHMPWENFARLTDDDVRSVYRFLRTLPPVKHLVGPTRRKVGEKIPGS